MSHKLNQPFDISADWFLPGNPGLRVPGILHYSTEGIKVDLNDSFESEDKVLNLNTITKYPVVWGFTTSCEQVTLLEAQGRLSFSLAHGVHRAPEHLRADTLVLGSHI